MNDSDFSPYERAALSKVPAEMAALTAAIQEWRKFDEEHRTNITTQFNAFKADMEKRVGILEKIKERGMGIYFFITGLWTIVGGLVVAWAMRK